MWNSVHGELLMWCDVNVGNPNCMLLVTDYGLFVAF